LRLIAAIEEWIWARYRTPRLPLELKIDSPTRALTTLRHRYGAFHSVRCSHSGVWRVRLHLPDGTVHAETAETLERAITALAARLGVRS
jgi:hypothetical protein